MFNWFKLTKRPRIFGGAISAKYMGPTINEAPTPKPPIIRAITKLTKSTASAEATAEMAYNTAAASKIARRPSRSLKGPAVSIPKVAVSVKEPTAQPKPRSLNPNSGRINRTTPETTEASKPIKKPPKATLRPTRHRARRCWAPAGAWGAPAALAFGCLSPSMFKDILIFVYRLTTLSSLFIKRKNSAVKA